jgi:hypothetical protein
MTRARAGYIIRFPNEHETATCVKCGEDKSLNNFYQHSVRGDGAIRYRNPCKQCRQTGPRTQWTRPVFCEIIKNNKQVCGICKIEKSLDNFYSNGCFKDGVKKYRTTCKECVKERANNKYHDEKDKTTHKRGLNPRNYVTTLLNKASHRKRNQTLDISYVMEIYEKQKGLCALSGREMTHITGEGRVWTNISIDRINSKLDYVKGNVQLTCLGPNIMKQNMTQSEFLEWCSDILSHLKGALNFTKK